MLQVEDTIDELRGQVSNELMLLGVLNPKGVDKTLERVQLLHKCVAALKSFNLRQFVQYQEMLQTGKPVRAGNDGQALAAVLKQLETSKLVEGFKQETEKLSERLAEERDDMPHDA